VDRTLFVLTLILILLRPNPVHAYIDPGAGSVAYQVLLTGLMMLGFTFRRSLGRLAGALRRWRRRSSDSPTNGAK
jgi:amino acid permease